MFKIATTTTTTIDLASLPYANWPEEAKALACEILSTRRREYFAMFPELRHDWMARQVSRMQQFNDRLLSDWL